MIPERIKKIVAVALAFSLLCGVTAFAMMFTKTQKEENKFTPGYVDCYLEETVVQIPDSSDISKTSIKVKNIGSDGTTPTNVKAYIRVGFVSYWVYGTGEDKGKVAPIASVMPSIDFDENNWVKVDGYYYYKEPVAPGEETVNLLEDGKSIIVTGLGSDGTVQVLEVFAEAIQSEPADAVTSSWGVSVDENGNITSAP